MQQHRSSSGVAAGIDIIASSTRHDHTANTMVLRSFRRSMRRWFGGRWKQMSDGEVKELEKKIAADMRAGTFRPVERTVQPPTADDLWQEGTDANAGASAGVLGPTGRLPTMSSSKTSTTVSQASPRGRYHDEYGDDYGGYRDAYGQRGARGAASSDSGYGPGYYDWAPQHRQPAKASSFYVPGGGPFDMTEAKPEPEPVDDDDGGWRANSMRSNAPRSSRRPPTQGYYPPSSSAYAEGRAYSMRSDPGRLYARSPMPRTYVKPQPSWDGRQQNGGAHHAYGGDSGYHGWNGENIEEQDYPDQGQGIHYQDYHYMER